MDQVKVILANIKKYHFWILCGIVVLIGLTSWYMSTSSLDAEAKKNGDDIKAKESAVQNVLSITPHPNREFLEGMDKLIEAHSISIGRGWQSRYAQQKDLLVWPKRLGPDFIRQVDGLRPIEEHVGFDEAKSDYISSQEINGRYLEIYRNFITQELPTLAERIGAKWTAKAGEGGASSTSGPGPRGKSAYGGAGAYRRSPPGGARGSEGTSEELEDDSVVYWNEENQQEILNEHFKFVSENKTPHTLDVLYAQEDLWVLEAIVNVIKKTNGDADANYNAAIKEIESLQIGRTVRGRLGLITPLSEGTSPGGAGQPGYVGSMAMSGGSGGASGAMPMPPAAGGTSPMAPPMAGGAPMAGGQSPYGMAGTVSLDPATGRYVDIDYNPLSPKDLRSARESTDPKLAIYAVAKRMPVRLRLRIDQRKLNDLLAECGNSSLPIEVRQVRINCDASAMSESATPSSYGPPSAGGAGGGYSAPGAPKVSSLGGSSGGGSAYGRSGGASRRPPGYQGAGGSSSSEPEQDPNEVVVDVYGIVHIYNPLNQKQLNTNLREDGADPGPVPAPTPTAGGPAVAPPQS